MFVWGVTKVLYGPHFSIQNVCMECNKSFVWTVTDGLYGLLTERNHLGLGFVKKDSMFRNHLAYNSSVTKSITWVTIQKL